MRTVIQGNRIVTNLPSQSNSPNSLAPDVRATLPAPSPVNTEDGNGGLHDLYTHFKATREAEDSQRREQSFNAWVDGQATGAEESQAERWEDAVLYASTEAGERRVGELLNSPRTPAAVRDALFHLRVATEVVGDDLASQARRDQEWYADMRSAAVTVATSARVNKVDLRDGAVVTEGCTVTGGMIRDGVVDGGSRVSFSVVDSSVVDSGSAVDSTSLVESRVELGAVVKHSHLVGCVVSGGGTETLRVDGVNSTISGGANVRNVSVDNVVFGEGASVSGGRLENCHVSGSVWVETSKEATIRNVRLTVGYIGEGADVRDARDVEVALGDDGAVWTRYRMGKREKKDVRGERRGLLRESVLPRKRQVTRMRYDTSRGRWDLSVVAGAPPPGLAWKHVEGM